MSWTCRAHEKLHKIVVVKAQGNGSKPRWEDTVSNDRKTACGLERCVRIGSDGGPFWTPCGRSDPTQARNVLTVRAARPNVCSRNIMYYEVTVGAGITWWVFVLSELRDGCSFCPNYVMGVRFVRITWWVFVLSELRDGCSFCPNYVMGVRFVRITWWVFVLSELRDGRSFCPNYVLGVRFVRITCWVFILSELRDGC
jgi:hypothetical protein